MSALHEPVALGTIQARSVETGAAIVRDVRLSSVARLGLP